jgi:cytosine deaminase
MGLPPIEVAPGAPADLVAVAAGTARGAIATASSDRAVFRRGELVRRTRVEEEAVATPAG